MLAARIAAVALACAVMTATSQTVNAADVPAANATAIDARTACATEFSATTVAGDPNAVVVHARDLPGPFTGTITAYGTDRMWTATIERAALVSLRNWGREASVMVRADAPIEGIVYAPAWASCTFYAGARNRNGYDAPDIDRPTLTAGNPQQVERATCEHPYAATKVVRAFEPTGNGRAAPGTVSVAVALDERGVAQFTRVVFSADPLLNGSAADAAKRSQYSGAVFRCKPVPSGYEFTVEYN
jgi:hypothetical protein